MTIPHNPLTKDEREAVRDRLIQAIGTACELYVLLERDEAVERVVVELETGRAGRHLAAARAMLKPGGPGGG